MKYLYLCLCFLLLGGTIYCVVFYFGQETNAKKVAAYTNLVQRGKEITAEYDSEYTERTIKVMRVPVKTYEMKYSFTVNGKTYRGRRVLDKAPTSATLKVWYDPENPAIFSTSPEEDLKAEKESSKSTSMLWIAGVLGLMSLGTYGKYDDLKKKAA